ncbi:MAG: bifunctional riboflavin kinase/FAD synthetase [Fusobacteriaceae bacterium]|nr:bifunctional riboflavin kinase/FAD synthetase [Fusobacteriaceae bacterium]MBP9510324.1 bifunctional riboflavin kinase/FAD synthetase [Fusobacteriaceae bacterium]
MKLIFDIFNNREIIENSYVAIGNFDGLHIGHKILIKKAVNAAKEKGGVSVVFTFLDHPKNKNNDSGIPKTITTMDEKIYIFEKLGVDYIVFQPFSEEFCTLSGEEFVKDIIKEKLGTKGIFVGFNFRFGKHQSNGINELKEYCDTYDIELKELSPVKVDDKIVSSTAIRSAIVNGDLGTVNRFLGEPYFISGEVIHGKKLGRVLGFPTANLEMKDKIYLPYGIYGGYASIEGSDEEYDVVINIGRNPTLKPNEHSIEVHILNFNRDIYGKKIYISVVRHIRDEIKFNSMDELKVRINEDVKYWKEYLKNIENGVDCGDNN